MLRAGEWGVIVEPQTSALTWRIILLVLVGTGGGMLKPFPIPKKKQATIVIDEQSVYFAWGGWSLQLAP